ncbi:periostin [Aplysia californica]|uniref:Periostin n=1 Tax=Aplysia californica TaxID=6500 RepID=A0ABM0K9H6_APLCA|nr:periostin [Aplysia californica]
MSRCLLSDGPYTILVPVDSAFAKLDQAELTNLQTSPGLLDEVLGVHVIKGELFSWDFVSGRVIVSDNGHFIRVYKTQQGTYVNDAKVLKWDVEANGAVLIFIDTLLDAPEGTIYEVLRKPEFGLSLLGDFVDAAGLNRTLHRTAGPYTMFAPSADAFAKLSDVITDRLKRDTQLLKYVLEYHVHPGTLHLQSLDRNGTLTTLYRNHNIGVSVTDDIRLNGVAMLEEADIDCDNGVIHIIDHVLLPSSLGSVIG